MRTSTAFFAGIGTVIVAITAGLGGGLLLGNIMSPHEPKYQSSEVTRLEQRKSPPPISAMNTASQPVPYMASSQVAAAVAEPAPQQKQTEAPPQPQSQQAAAQPADVKPAPAAVQPAASTEQPAVREPAASEDSFAKARDAEIKRETRRVEERRARAERRQQWTERRRMKPREDEDLRDVEASVRQATGPRPLFGEPRFGSRIGLFDD